MRTFVFVLLFAVIPFASSCAQSSSKTMSDIVEHKGITSPLHQANVGNVVFMPGIFPVKVYKESEFLSSFEIENDSDLNFIAFLDNSLTNYLHQLDPTLSVDELLKRGNFQFSFYIDSKLVYTENLNRGAGLPRRKNQDTILHKPLISSINADSWGRFLWARFLYRTDAYTTLVTGTHVVKIELRPYLNSDEGLIVGDLIAEGEISLKYAEPEVNEAEKAIQPIQPNSGWEISKDRYDEEKIRALNERIAQKRFNHITSIVVIKDGKLLFEEYFNGSDRNTLHNTRSVGKSFAATITGIAIQDGHFKGVDQTLDEFYDLRQYPNYSSKKAQVTLESLLTMSSAFHGSDNDSDTPGNDSNMYPSNDWAKFTLDLPMDKNKENGEVFDYFTAGSVLLGDIIQITVPGGLEGYADEKLFKPLGISRYKWQYTPKGIAHTAGGLALSALDFAKYGQLYKNKGMWNEKQVLSEEWVEQSLTNHFADTPNQPAYGYLFWNEEFSTEKKSYNAFYASGYGGNKVIMFTDEPLVIVITATAFGQPYAHPQAELMIEKYILPAVLE
ncbi:MAG: class C beta-lactamase-related serine hydrolase [Balneola sp.]|nr:MAG: class C beta-lactamase-related serine hydrolase [Balneola sp.]